MISSHPDKDNPRDAVAYSADKAATQPEVGVPGKKEEHRSPSPVEDATNGVMEDAERKGTEERIRFQAKLLDAVGQAVIATDSQGKVLYWNRAAEELYGWPEEEVMGRSIIEVTPSEEMVERAEEIMSELMAGRSWSGEFVVRRKDGTSFPAMVTDTPVHDEEGNLMAIIGVSMDITKLKETEELRRSEERFRALTHNSSDIITLLGADGTIRYQSPSVERILGYRPEEMLGENVFGYVHPEDLGWVQGKFVEGLADPDLRQSAEYRFRHKDGSWCYLESVGSNLLGDPTVGEFVVNSRDITERKEAEEALKKNEERFRSLVQNSTDLITVVNADGIIIYQTPSMKRTLGHDPEDRVGKNIFTSPLIHPDDVAKHNDLINLAIRNPSSEPVFEVRLRHRDGTWRWIESIISNLLDDPNVGGIVLNSRDITERKEAEEAIERLSRHNQLILDSAGEGIYGLDREGRTTFVNPAAAALTGFGSEEVIGKDQHDTIHYSRPDGIPYPKEECPIHATMREGEVRQVDDEVFRRKDGTSFPVEYTSTPIWEDGEVIGAVVTFTDITERKEAEEEKSRQARHASLRAEVNVALAKGGTLRSILQRCTKCMVRHLDAAFARIWTLNEEEDVLELEASAGMYTHLDGPHSRVPLGEYKIGLIGQEGRPHLTNDVSGDPRTSDKEWAEREGMVAFAGHPLVVEGRLVGVMAMFAREPLEEDAIEALASVADTVAQGIKRKRADEALKRSEKTLTEAQRIAHLGNSGWNLKTGEVYWSEETYRIYGFEPNEFSPTFEIVEGVFHSDDRYLFKAIIEDAYQGAESYDFEHRIVRADEEVRWVHRLGEVVRGEGGEPLRITCTVQDITEHKALEGRLEYQAYHDELTDLPNRRLFMDRLKQALRRTKRRKGSHKVAVLYLDLDNFKVVNDSLGHEAGDLLLVAVAERLRGSVRPEDTLARFGGDEFAVLVEDVQSPEDALRVAERIIEDFRGSYSVEGREYFIKPSIGIALGTARTKRPEELLRDADTAMYQVKGQDEDYRVFDSTMYEQALRRLKLESDLRRAIKDEEFVVCYQPIVDLETGEASGVEALVRWEHPEHQGLIAPSQFIPVAEEAGLVVPMGRWVLEEACRQGARWQQEHPHVPPLIVSVNLSARQLQHPDVAEMVEETLKETGFDARYLSLDITETLYIEALECNSAALDKIKRMGVCISIDDFGTGYSSLAYLKRIPAETLKIDKSFIKGIGEDLEDTAIVRMIIELAHTLGMEVIAEGVESEEQAEQLKEMGCDWGQGFYFARPLSPEEAARFISR